MSNKTIMGLCLCLLSVSQLTSVPCYPKWYQLQSQWKEKLGTVCHYQIMSQRSPWAHLGEVAAGCHITYFQTLAEGTSSSSYHLSHKTYSVVNISTHLIMNHPRCHFKVNTCPTHVDTIGPFHSFCKLTFTIMLLELKIRRTCKINIV